MPQETCGKPGSAAEVEDTDPRLMAKRSKEFLSLGKTPAEEPPDRGIPVSVAWDSRFLQALEREVALNVLQRGLPLGQERAEVNRHGSHWPKWKPSHWRLVKTWEALPSRRKGAAIVRTVCGQGAHRAPSARCRRARGSSPGRPAATV